MKAKPTIDDCFWETSPMGRWLDLKTNIDSKKHGILQVAWKDKQGRSYSLDITKDTLYAYPKDGKAERVKKFQSFEMDRASEDDEYLFQIIAQYISTGYEQTVKPPKLLKKDSFKNFMKVIEAFEDDLVWDDHYEYVFDFIDEQGLAEEFGSWFLKTLNQDIR